MQVGFRAETEGDYFVEVFAPQGFPSRCGVSPSRRRIPLGLEVSPSALSRPCTSVAVSGFNIGGAEEMNVDPRFRLVPWRIMDLPLSRLWRTTGDSGSGFAVASYPAMAKWNRTTSLARRSPSPPTRDRVDAVLDVERAMNHRIYYRIYLEGLGESVLIDVERLATRLPAGCRGRCARRLGQAPRSGRRRVVSPVSPRSPTAIPFPQASASTTGRTWPSTTT